VIKIRFIAHAQKFKHKVNVMLAEKGIFAAGH